MSPPSFRANKATTEGLIVAEVERILFGATIRQPSAVGNFPVAGKEGAQRLHTSLTDGKVALLDKLRHGRADQGR